MNFVSWAFVGLFLLVMAARLTIGRRKTEPAYDGVLLVASLVFYGWHVPQYIGILLGSALIDYAVSRSMARWPVGDRRRAWLLTLSVVTNLGLLGFFKYAHFGAQAVEHAGAWFGQTLRLDPGSLVLPMGISFYTFQTLSYTVDVYRGDLRPIRSFWQFTLFIAFFPQLVAGPIVRASEFLPQIPRPRRLRLRVFYHGVWLVVCGTFLKMVCADNLAAYVDEFWERGYRPQTDATFSAWLAMMFSGQIFADFAGYSTIARGLGYLLGFRFPVNFNAPYIASTFKEFWQRWHITLSQWLRDYLYRPLGGNRGSRARTLINLMLVMLLGGLWHGAAYTFIVWGAIHGTCLVVERSLGLHRRDGRGLAVRAAWFVVVQIALLAAWVFFRSATVGQATMFLMNIATGDWRLPDLWMVWASLFGAPLVAMHVWTRLEERGRVRSLAPGAQALLTAAMAYAVFALGGGTSEFIYFQF